MIVPLAADALGAAILVVPRSSSSVAVVAESRFLKRFMAFSVLGLC